MWFKMDMNQCQRQDEIENLNIMAKKCSILSEKQNREKMIAQRERMQQEDINKEKEADKELLAAADRNIRIEHEKLMEQRDREKERYTKMLIENKKVLAKRQRHEENVQVEDKKLIKTMMDNEEKMQRQREAEFNRRLEKIQAKMSKMADGVVKNAKEKELKEERRLLALQTEKERMEIQDEKDRKNRQVNQNRMVQN